MALTLARESDIFVAARREPPGISSEFVGSHWASAPHATSRDRCAATGAIIGYDEWLQTAGGTER